MQYRTVWFDLPGLWFCAFVPFLWRVFASTFELLDFSWSLVMVISTGIVGGCVFVMYISYTISSGVFTSSSSSSCARPDSVCV